MTRKNARTLLAGIALLAATPAFAQPANESTAALVKRSIDAAAKQYATLLPKVQSKEGFPRTVENG
ncbi:MAG: hypothetical protein EOO81_10960, partial [Oxalobacteraceae bacterium]